MTYSPNILAAVELLDADSPGWHRKIDLGTLDLCDNKRCVVGQVYGDGGPHTRYELRARHPDITVCAVFSPDYSDQWRALIAERQAADTPVSIIDACASASIDELMREIDCYLEFGELVSA